MRKKKKTISQLKKQIQPIFNKWIRERDKDRLCISCGEKTILQCGHYFPVKGNDSLRFNEDNANGECAKCNGFDGSHLIWYGRNLINKIGIDRYEALIELAKHYRKTPKIWTREELEQIKLKYNGKTKN